MAIEVSGRLERPFERGGTAEVAEVFAEDGDKLQSGSTVQVMYDYAAGASSPMPDSLRKTLEDFDGPF